VSEWHICISESPQEKRFFALRIHEFKKGNTSDTLNCAMTKHKAKERLICWDDTPKLFEDDNWINKSCTEQGFLHGKHVITSRSYEHFVTEFVGFVRQNQYCMPEIEHLTFWNQRSKLWYDIMNVLHQEIMDLQKHAISKKVWGKGWNAINKTQKYKFLNLCSVFLCHLSFPCISVGIGGKIQVTWPSWPLEKYNFQVCRQ